MRFRTTIIGEGKNAAGIQVPDEVVDSFGAGKRPPVVVTVNGYSYRNTVAVMGGVYMVSISAQHRAASGVSAGDELDIDVALDTQPRTVPVPDDLAAALDADPDAKRTWDAGAYSYRKEVVRSLEDAKTEETRARRLAKAVTALHEGHF